MSEKPNTPLPTPPSPEKPAKLTAEEIDRLVKEGLDVRRALAARIAPMKVVTADDLKTRMR